MTGEVLPFPARPRLAAVTPPAMAVGDVVVACVNATLNLWCAWPIAVVDDDGVVLGVHRPDGKVIGLDRMTCLPDVYGFRAGDHAEGAFRGLFWKTWRAADDAVKAFAGAARSP